MIAIAPIRRRRIINKFYEREIFDEERACSLDCLGLRNNLLIRRMVEKRILIKTPDERYFLNREYRP